VHAVVLYGTEGRAAAVGKEEKAFNRKFYNDMPLKFPGNLAVHVSFLWRKVPSYPELRGAGISWIAPAWIGCPVH
jgi:hypothetical protein